MAGTRGQRRTLFAVIAAARERARRRRRLLTLSACLVIAAAVGVIATRHAPLTPTGSLSGSAVFAVQPPYLGVACRRLNSTGCGRVGVAVWLKHHVDQLTASVDGQRLELHDTTVGRAYVQTYIGYLHLSPRQLRLPQHWIGSPPRPMAIRLRAILHGETAARTLRLQLHPGWG
jgi:hypothetical protein